MKHHLSRPRLARTVIAATVLAAAANAQTSASIVNTKHNLSAQGPGQFKALSESRVCIFCHAPHRAATTAPLWNRSDSTQTYLPYTSSTNTSGAGQPNGTTKLCLSCHDGSIALGKVSSLTTEITMQTGFRYLSSGRSSIGSNLRDDHPVSFHYASSKGGSGTDYLNAASITAPVRLDKNGMVQCTSCHNAHDNSLGSFLRATDRNGALCLSCHQPRDWSAGSHATSTKTWNTQGSNPWPNANYLNVKENACMNCHTPHAAGQPARLKNFALEEDNCLRCHNGNVAAKNIQNDLGKSSRHDVTATSGTHDPTEDPLTMSRHVECEDCHNPHTAKSGTAAAPGVPGPLFGISGINTTGQVVSRITYGYELCYKCHADNNSGVANVPRQVQQTNVRLEFDPNNPSYHPIEAVGKNPDVPSLLSGWTTSSRMACTSCHQSNSSPDFGGTGARGPHGSTYAPMLGARMETGDPIKESSAVYALCYKCHSRTSILGDNSFKEHDKHIRGEDASCSICHDPHGISWTQGNSTNHAHLINFDTRVAKPANNRLEFINNPTQRFKGACYVNCHGKKHTPKSY